MDFNYWFLLAGLVLTLMALVGSVLKRLPLSAALLYLGVGVAIGPAGLGMIALHPLEQVELIERLAEIAVVLSLFAAGLKLRAPFTDARWHAPVRLAFVSMTITVGLIALLGHWGLGLSWGAAVLLGAVLAPTDPVLASDVQIESPDDCDRLRFSLTGEAGLNDGTAFPFVMLGLGLLGLHELGPAWSRWLGIDVVWAIIGGLGIGAGMGALVGRLVVYLRQHHKEAVGLDDFLALGLVSLSYGVAIWLSTYAFLAAFASGLALRAVERRYSGEAAPPEEVREAANIPKVDQEEIAVGEDTAPAYMASAVLGFSEQFERIGLVTMVIVAGALLVFVEWSLDVLWFVPVLFLVVRPLAVAVGLVKSDMVPVQRRLISWFGIRGIGSIYYLTYAIRHGLPEAEAWRLLGLVLTVIAVSAVVHGISVTPIMNWYGRWQKGHPTEA